MKYRFKVSNLYNEKYVVYACEVLQFVPDAHEGAKQELQQTGWNEVFRGTIIECDVYIRLAENNHI
jgi:hypothetical protein